MVTLAELFDINTCLSKIPATFCYVKRVAKSLGMVTLKLATPEYSNELVRRGEMRVVAQSSDQVVWRSTQTLRLFGITLALSKIPAIFCHAKRIGSSEGTVTQNSLRV